MSSNNPNFKTSVCKYAYVGCKQQNKCWYAHNKNELRQRYCVNSDKCSDQTCCYLHPNQTIEKDEYYLKVLLKSNVLGIDKNIIKRHLSDKFIIEIETEEYETEEYENDDHNSNNNDELSNVNDEVNKTDDNNDNSMEIEDLNLNNYVNQFTDAWNALPNQFYEMKDNKLWKNINIKVNETQLQNIMKYLQNTNIEFNFEK